MPTKKTIAPNTGITPANELPAPKPKKQLTAPKSTKKLSAPKPTKQLLAPTPTKKLPAPTPKQELAAPKPTKQLAAPKSGKERTDVNNPEQVAAYMAQLNYPLKAKVEALRKIIHNVNKDITEQIKWNAPSFSYKGYLVTFSLRRPNEIVLVFHNGIILHDDTGLLQGDYPDRRLAYFRSMQDVKSKKAALEKIIQEWITLMDNRRESLS